jgi:membrane-bound inhibitor of C-type lysozyme
VEGLDRRIRSSLKTHRSKETNILNKVALFLGAAIVGAIAILTFGGSADATEAHYRCRGGARLTARFSRPSVPNGRVELTFDTGRELILPQVLSADGGRYANAGIEFWIKGRGATLTMNGVRETCLTR